MNMNIKKISSILVCAVAGSATGVVSCADSDMFCITAFGHYAVSLELDNTEGDCENAPVNLAELAGEQFYLETYADEGDDQQPDWSQGNVVIKGLIMGQYHLTATRQGVEHDAKQATSFGKFTTSTPDNNGVCALEFSRDAELNLEELPAEPDNGETGDDAPFPGQPAIDMTVAWSNTQFYVTPDVQGYMMTANLDMELNGCRASYSATGLYPQVSCETDDDCGAGSGINPSIDAKCDVEAGWCTLANGLASAN
ncbi:MAG: hypothetical protein B7733_26420 [Myxococcales bacterium FL481]|nr:MAG: hypothetical protein B7733_26420 [Myxococcales bacterium FL481]